ncbi:MAG: glycolate oxidase subunit GlcE [Pseudomonadota bacterium]|nr:glycolate oxidase subunit GlcE [Pseudomonadota bacterium]
MSSTFNPSSPTEVQETVEWALNSATPMAIAGNNSKKLLGQPHNLDVKLNLSHLKGIITYEPSELVLTARPGTTLKEVSDTLEECGQELAFEPPDYGPFFGEAQDKATLGGTIACNLSGPRRIRAGGARDHFLGMQAVNGRAEIFKAGGKVVKNVTGYDLCKLIAGSYGTLALLTETTLKVLPKSEKVRTILVSGLTDQSALSIFQKVMAGPKEPSALAHLPNNIAKRSSVDLVSEGTMSISAIRLEGPAPSVLRRTETLVQDLQAFGHVAELHGRRSKLFWKEIANLNPFVGNLSSTIWRVIVAPSNSSSITRTLSTQFDISWFYDWAGGLIWIESEFETDALHTAIRALVAAAGGQSLVIRRGKNLSASTEIFQPLPKSIFQLNYRVKQSFDPKVIFNPGRVYTGI